MDKTSQSSLSFLQQVKYGFHILKHNVVFLIGKKLLEMFIDQAVLGGKKPHEWTVLRIGKTYVNVLALLMQSTW